MIENFAEKLEKYAEVMVKIGVNLQPGQRLMIYAPIQQQQLVRLVAEKAYQNGCRLVDVQWADEGLILKRYQYAPRDSFSEVPQWRYDAGVQFIENGDALLHFASSNPRLLIEQDPELVGEAQQAALQANARRTQLVTRNATNWNIIAAPNIAWNAQVFPDLSPEAAEEAMWEAIFAMSRINSGDPVEGWRAHIKELNDRAAYLNAKAYDSFHLTGPATDLRIGMPEGHRWCSAAMRAQNNIDFVANMPTEEIFTLPHRNRAEGHISSTKPLSYGGQIMEDFTLTFENGRVSKAVARVGEVALLQLLDTDEGSRSMGEFALVPHSSPISQTGRVFSNTLIDENAATHIALGAAYKFTLDGGTNLSDEEFSAAGGNLSRLHMDFMVGSDKLNVDGIKADGQPEPVMRGGEWAFDV
jgi:aminopeptidase